MNKEIMHNEVLFSHKEERNYVIYRKVDRTGNNHVKQNKAVSERQMSHFLSYMKSKTKHKQKDMNVQRRLFGMGALEWGDHRGLCGVSMIELHCILVQKCYNETYFCKTNNKMSTICEINK
jgi:hypothetical protein